MTPSTAAGAASTARDSATGADPAQAGKDKIEAIYPLPPIQQGMLYHSLLEPHSGAYVPQYAVALHGDLKPAHFRRAWAALLQRQAVLRSVFVRLNTDKPLQVVLKQVAVPLELLDWRELASTSAQTDAAESAPVAAAAQDPRDAYFQQLLHSQWRQGFVPTQAPLLRLLLVRWSEQEWRLVWTYHHALSDGWSTPLILRELAQLYRHSLELSRNQGDEEASLGAANIQALAQSLPPATAWRDYIRWWQAQDKGQAEHYWQQHLQTLDRAANGLAELAPAQADGSHQGEKHEVYWQADAALSAALRQLAAAHHITLNVLIQGVWALLLAARGNSRWVNFGATLSGRPASLPGVERLVGQCINSVPVLVDCAAQQCFGPWLQSLQQAQVQREQFGFLALWEIKRAAGVAGDRELFDSLVVFENYPSQPWQGEILPGVEARPLSSVSQNHYPLSLVLFAREQLEVKLKFDPRRLSRSVVESILQRLQQGLQQLVALAQSSPSQANAPLAQIPLARLQFLSAEQQAEQLQRAQGPQASWGVAELPQLVRQWALEQPTALALTQGEEGWSYAQLWSGISQRAHALRQLEVGPGDRVLLCLPRSAELVFQLLAVQSRGAIAVPLEPSAPAAQLQRIVDDAQAQLIIAAQASLETLLSLEQEAELLVVERDQADWAEAPKDIEPISLGGAGTAYLIYTSGSTGQPKGVAVSQANLSHYARAVMERLDLPADASLGALATVAADLGYTALYGALASGRSLRILPESLNLDAQALATELRQRPLDALKLTPSHLQALVQASGELDWLPKTLICGGEALNPALVQQIQSQRPDCRIFNHYGPSETTVGVLCGEVVSKSLQPDLSAPLGTPLAGCSAYVLDQALNPVAPGGLGELYLGGAGVSQGYWGRSRETAERFIPHPWAAGERLYRSGDQVRVDEQGQLHFQGRGDGQVKVRGHRVELAALGWQLEQLEAIQQAVVLLEQGQLRAYLVGKEQELSGWFNQHWPEYQHPQQVHWLQALPLTANGKLDRAQLRNLPAPGQAGVSSAPRNALEEQLLQLWQGLLGRQDIGIHDGFFAAGGHSLLLIQLHAQVRQLLLNETNATLIGDIQQRAQNLQVVDLFRHSTVARLAAFLQQPNPGQGAEARQAEVSL